MAGEREIEWAHMGCAGFCWGVPAVGGEQIGAYCSHLTCVDGLGKRKRWHRDCICEHLGATSSLLSEGKWECPSCAGAYRAGGKAALHEAAEEGMLVDTLLKKNEDKKPCPHCGRLVNYKNLTSAHIPFCKVARQKGIAVLHSCGTCGKTSWLKAQVRKDKHSCADYKAALEAKAAAAQDKAEKKAAAKAAKEAAAATEEAPDGVPLV